MFVDKWYTLKWKWGIVDKYVDNYPLLWITPDFVQAKASFYDKIEDRALKFIKISLMMKNLKNNPPYKVCNHQAELECSVLNLIVARATRK